MTQENADLIAGRYQLVERIGQGGMGRVWRGTDQHLFGREVAVKEILFPPGLEDGERGRLLKRFTGEARAAVTLSHPGIITIHDVVEHNGSPVIVMEFVRGQSLAAAIRDQGRLPVRRVAEIGAAMLGALAEAHGAGIVHRDIKPDNILLSKDRVVLTDFGIAHLADASTRLSHSGAVIGTPMYMPPEQLEGKRPTPANDLWALGATLYHAVEGRPPFDAEGLHALAIAVFTRPHRPPTEAGPLGPVLEALLTKDPAQRVSLAGAVGLLAEALRESGTTSTPLPSPTPLPRPAPVPVPTPHPAPEPVAPDPDDSSASHLPPPERLGTPPVPRASDPAPPPLGTPAPGPHGAPPEGQRPDAATPSIASTPSIPATPSRPSPALGGAGSFPSVTYRRPDLTAAASRRPSVARRATVVAVALVVAAIGGIVAKTFAGDDSAGASGGTGGASSAAANGGGPAAAVTVAIGLDAPLSGSLAAFGLSLKNSAELAVRTANQTRYVPGVTFELKALDDQAQPAKGEQNAGQFVGDNKVLGVVGPLNSSVAQSMLGVLDQAGLVDVSPANTNPVLTQGADWAKGSKSRPYKTYFRTVTTDAAQGPFAAQYLYKEARKTRLFVIDDKKSYGTSLAAGFSSEFTRLGGSVVGTEHTNPDDRDFPTLAARVKTSGADAVYYGGDYPAAAALSQQLKQAGANVPLMGGDGIYAPEFISLNPKAEGDLASSVGAPPQELPSAKSFLSQYRAAGYPEDPGSYGGYAYDSVWAVIEAVRSVVAANGGALPVDARAKVVKAMAGVAFDGVTGRVAFDEYGDTLNRQLTVSTVRGGSWATVKTGTYTP